MPEFCGVGEAADLLDVRRETLWRWRQDGKGPDYVEAEDGEIYYYVESVCDWNIGLEYSEDVEPYEGPPDYGSRLEDGFEAIHGPVSDDGMTYDDGTALW
jgi:hypothetical protein